MTAINFPASPSNGDTHQGFVYNATLGVWQSAGTQTAVTSFAGLSDTPSTLGTAGQIAKVNSGATALEFADQSGVTVYANVDALPGSGNTGDLAFVTATNRLYIWNGSGWYNIALINTTPSISGVNSSYSLAIDGTATVITITAVDAEGLPITYSIASDTSGNAATVVQGTGANTNVFTITPSTNTANAGTFSLTFRASDGVNIASAVSEFTLQFNVQNQNYTTALITSVGANNAVNNSFVDSSTNSHTLTAAGNATQNTFSPYRHGGYSTYFDGAGDYLKVADSAEHEFGTGDFSIEFWWWPETLTGGTGSLHIAISAPNDSHNQLVYHESTYWYYAAGAGGTVRVSSSGNGPATAKAWNHVVLCRTGTTLSIFHNGTRTGSVTSSYSADFSNTSIGRYDSGGYEIDGYIRDMRWLKGSSAYDATQTSITVPTEPLTAITNTKLLTCHLPYIADGSTTGHSITVYGNTKTEPFAPYDEQEYSAASHGGSIYFDGSGDYVTVPNHTSLDLASNDFTIEFWAYSSNPNTAWPLGKGNASSAAGSSISWYWGGGYTDFYSGGSGVTLSHGAIFPANQWFHVACCRSGNDFTFYLNGVSVATTSTSGAINTTTNDMWVGAYPGAAGFWPGTIADFRFVKGTAVYTSDFTPPTAPLTAISGTSVLLKGIDAGIIDKSQSNKFLTLSGDAKSSTTQSKYLSSSMYFDGSGDNILTDVMTTGGDFTVEMWIRFDGSVANPASQSPTFFVWGTTTFMLYCTIANNTMQMIGNGSGLISGTTTISADTWYHVAFARQGSTGRLFVNGNLEGSTTSFSTNLNARAVIGSEESAGYPLKGYISDLRITKGLARYTSAFTAPAAALQG
jgi:hypothetical protein